MSNFSSLIAHSGSKYSNKEWSKYVEMPQVSINKTPSEWMKQIWEHLTYFRENDLLPIENKKYLEARRLIRLPNSGNYNHIEIERHWKFSYTGNKYCGISYKEYLQKIEKKSILGYDYDN
ncbi:15864_t:CDS:2, partial [Gigaspora margarita]